jgi:hypothetical protein
VKASRGDAEEKRILTWPLTHGIEALVETAQHGRIVWAGDEEERWSDISRSSQAGRLSIIVYAPEARQCLTRIRNVVFSWASTNYSALQLGDAATRIWQDHRARVDHFLANISLTGHVAAITHGLGSTEPQEWRQAMWSTRDLLHDVAGYLWRDKRKTYKHLLDDEGKPIEVTADKFVNSLMAYMHQKGITGTLGAELRADWARLRGLNSLASSAHDKAAVTLEDAKLTFFATYLLLGELVQRSDCKPVETY